MVGAGSWGTTIAALASHNAHTMLWSRRAALAEEINSQHTNSAYLGTAVLPDALHASSDLHAALAQADVVAMAVPSQGFWCADISPTARAYVAWTQGEAIARMRIG